MSDKIEHEHRAWVAQQNHTTHIGMGGYDATCPLCAGTGALGDGSQMCERCNGIGVVCVAAPRNPVPTVVKNDERRVRINITKNTKEYSYETTVELTTTGTQDHLDDEIAIMMRGADVNAQHEIALREAADQEG